MVKRLGRGRLFSAALGLRRLGFPPPRPRFAQLPSWQARLLRKLRSGQPGRDACPRQRLPSAAPRLPERLLIPRSPRAGFRSLKVSSPLSLRGRTASRCRGFPPPPPCLAALLNACLPAALGWTGLGSGWLPVFLGPLIGHLGLKSSTLPWKAAGRARVRASLSRATS